MSKQLEKLYRAIRSNSNVLDVGCLGFGQVGFSQELGLQNINHYGVDYVDHDGNLPVGFVFKQVDLNKNYLPFQDDMFDLVTATHVIEHLTNPVEFFGECIRVCRPGGYLYLSAPSERSLLFPGMPFERDKFFSLSFFDDPTHISRPWTPQALYRMTKYYACEPIETNYQVSWKHRLAFPLTSIYALLTKNGKLLEASCWGAFGWASYLIARKPENLRGKPEFNYYIPSNR
jgi:SAM-dependent methyltransferase